MKKIYVIGLARYGCGLVSLLTSVYNHVRYAFQNGYVPIVDFKHYDNLYFKDDRKYHDNSWEYFFEQPMQKNLNDITSETSVIISPDTHIVDEQTSIVNSGDIPETEDDILTARQKDIKENFSKYIRLNKETEDYLKKESSKILKDVHFDEILGVLYRGTDYNSNKAKFEYAQSSVNQFIENIKAFLKKNPKIKKIYLATEDDEAYQLFKNTFGNQLLDNGQYRYSSKEKEKLLFEISSNRKNHHY